jgi:4-hydroxy-tetrahydrodipicolinate reductase
MGREIDAVLSERDHSVVARIDPSGVGDAGSVSAESLADAEVAIEFSAAGAVLDNARVYAAQGVSAVVGTTGWESDGAQVSELVETAGIGYLVGANFSIGANLFFALAEEAARLVDAFPDYDVLVREMHHRHKKDSPSGTALTLGNRLLSRLARKTEIVSDRLDRAIEPHELHVSSTRGGAVPGVHEVLLDSAADTIEIRHSARSRAGFALGAVLGAEWVVNRQGYFSVKEFIADLVR